MRFPDACIVQFAKVPIAGHVKTRLIPLLGKAGALQLHKKLLRHTWQCINTANLAPAQLWVDKPEPHDFFFNLQPAVGVLQLQQGRNLGERMVFAVQQELRRSTAVIVVGSDCPVLDESYLSEALMRLQQGSDVVLGPATDGGYVLIGMRRLHPEVFESISWGSGQVLYQTRQRLAALGCCWEELEERWDVDRPEDLQKLDGIDFA